MLQAENAVGHAVEKFAVVGNDQQRAGIRQQPALQPQHGVEVEMVGGFVQQQNVRRTHERLRQRQPHPPTAGKRVYGPGLVFRGEPETRHEGGGAATGSPAPRGVVVGVGGADARAIAAGFGGSHFALRHAHGQVAIHHELDSSTAVGGHFLGHAGQHLAGRALHVTGVSMQFTRDQGEQTGFAGAVRADDTRAVTTKQAETRVLEEGARAATESDLAKVDHGARSLAARCAPCGQVRTSADECRMSALPVGRTHRRLRMGVSGKEAGWGFSRSVGPAPVCREPAR